MQDIKVHANYIRIAPKKMRLVAHVLKGMPFSHADAQLRNMTQKSVLPLRKALHSAGANAEHNYHLRLADLFVRNILIDPGPSLKRMRPRARGSGFPILKRTSHVTVILGVVRGKEDGTQSKDFVAQQEIKRTSQKAEVHMRKKLVQQAKTRASRMKQRATTRRGAKTRVFQRKAI